VFGEHGIPGQVLERDDHVPAAMVDAHLAEKLKARRGRCVSGGRRLLKYDLWAERVVERVGAEAAGVERQFSVRRISLRMLSSTVSAGATLSR
jgi:hypothetical protein